MNTEAADTPEEHRNVALLRAAYEAYRQGDPQPFFALCADDIRFGLAASPEHFTFGGVRAGKDWVHYVIREIAEEFEWLSFEPRELIAERDWVIALTGGRIRDRHTGEVLDADIVDVIRMRDGKIAQFVEYFDSTMLYRRTAAQAKHAAAADPVAAPKPKAKAKRPAAKPRAAATPKPKAKAAPSRRR